MAAGGGQLECAPARVLASNVAQVLHRGIAGHRCAGGRRGRTVADELRVNLTEVAGSEQTRVDRELGLLRVVHRYHENAVCITHPERCGERSSGPAKTAVEGKLANKLVLVKPVVTELAGRSEHPDRDRQVVPAAVLGKLGRREVDGDADVWGT